MTNDLKAIEQQLFNDFSNYGERGRDTIFIVGAPRTGSTLLYLLLIKRFGLSYFPNIVNDLYHHVPAVGLMMWLGRNAHGELPTTIESRFGHTVGAFQPSEAKNVLNNWFNIEEPTETISVTPRGKDVEHLRKTFDFIDRVMPARFIIKNAWNCFRIKYWATEFENAKFIWMRRRLAGAALSDLHARYVIQGSPLGWNAATPRNVDDLKTLPYAEQVVENQLAYTRAISAARQSFPQERFVEIWYHDLILQPKLITGDLGKWLRLEDQNQYLDTIYDRISPRPGPDLPAGDVEAVIRYADQYTGDEM